MMYVKFCLIIILVIGCMYQCFGSVNSQNAWISDEDQLYENLMKDYNKFVRPAKTADSKIDVNFQLSLMKLIAVDEMLGSVTGQFWVPMRWNDERLTWNPETNNVSKIRIPCTELWNPDIYVYNAARGTGALDISGMLAVVYSQGLVECIPPVIIEAMCTLDMRQFPFDTQTCSFKFGSWVYNGNELDLNPKHQRDDIDLSGLEYSIEWDLTNTTGEKSLKYYPCCKEPYPEIVFNLTLKRRSKYFCDMFIGPSLSLALLTPFIFVLPSRGPHKINLAAFLFFIIVILHKFLDVVYASTLGQSPLLVRYYRTVLADIVVAVVVAAISSNIASRADLGIAPPAAIKRIFVDVIGRLLCVSSNHEIIKAAYVEGTAEGTHDTMRIAEPSGQVLHARDWITISCVLDRLAFIVFMSLSVVFAIIFLSH